MKDNKIEITNGQYVKLSYRQASSGSRVAALFIDRIIQYVLLFLAIYTIESQYSWHTRQILDVFAFVLIYTINLWQEVFWHGRTLGKFLMRIKVISDDCVPPTFQQCFTRWVLYPIDMWIIGILMIAEKGQRIGDMASGCYVIAEKDRKEVKVSLYDDYRYGKTGYTPVYTELEAMTDNEDDLVLKGLYTPGYTSQQSAIANHICKKLELDRKHMGAKDFLLRLHNDYMYYKSKG